ncbi:hypothetical protein CPAST_c34810 [Clostridium pasteurianum DSM 525 = ATCC 6013]|uniref:Uncharacterized protein n=1 Tax=Clostridium pasteurianum DSM 525 = ATCC 6013 TaxID=1262449 RepID=A0A0H3J8J2_CLOPA|nr:hypothetical protein [Clostridium pasteurianum]AJA49542.1 hypothetical protein CPAST_c34810 [Clostridium pasteurianum DSM 525 = ATCC 6013]AJA53530.1 hypothetical protein CLPA_c34810 [Clostridium pasteurianum DSM 525 = ATCC 6013]AOZ76699.1 hypothetical protein AQ983_16905 [Clostridium pasteurianum DSM 525 = ATCC 6013]AOZ80496.1 hypothetical protein AQ984_16900 [Clostridium pasteurianum]ELP58941.1 hypothetical protein F502_12471 [Clostridium pasteurianum DSM 525 = ATCC 6013]
MSSYNIRNTIYCENIKEEVRQKYDFGLLPAFNGQVNIIHGQDKCSGSSICKLQDPSFECSILKNEKNKKIEEQKEILVKRRQEEEKWNF